MSIRAWAPGHATLFFSVPKRYEDPLKMGSLGGGFNFSEGVITDVEKSSRDNILWNNKNIGGKVSLTALELFRELTEISEHTTISHYSNLKIGYGLSTSGAGAIGTLLALNELYDTNIPKTKLFQLAHIADVTNQTGLGSVMGQISSGVELRTKQGGPGIGEVKTKHADDRIILMLLGSLSTSDVLKSKDQLQQVTKVGNIAVRKAKEIKENNVVRKFMKFSEDFMQTCGLRTERVKKLKEKLSRMNEPHVSMAMIGETIVIVPNDIEKIISWANDNRIPYITTEITSKVPSIVY